MQKANEVAGYGLFSDVEDRALRIRNQAQTLKNIMEDNRVDDKFTTRGLAITTGYFGKIVQEDQQEVHGALSELFTKKAVL